MRTSRAVAGSRPPGREWKPVGFPRLLISPAKMWVTLTGGDVALHSSAAGPAKPRECECDRERATPGARSTVENTASASAAAVRDLRELGMGTSGVNDILNAQRFFRQTRQSSLRKTLRMRAKPQAAAS